VHLSFFTLMVASGHWQSAYLLPVFLSNLNHLVINVRVMCLNFSVHAYLLILFSKNFINACFWKLAEWISVASVSHSTQNHLVIKVSNMSGFLRSCFPADIFVL